MPLFSVVIPCFNKQDYIKQTIQSVLQQSYSNFEVIVVDDGSTDSSIGIIESFNDKRIKLVKQKNKGVSIARNKGTESSEGEYIAFLDADDLWEPDHLMAIYNLIKTHNNCGLYCSGYGRLINGQIKPSRYYEIPFQDKKMYVIDDYFKKCTFGNNIAWTSSVVVPKNILLEMGGFPEGVNRGEDRYVWGVIALKYKVAFYNFPTAIYRIVGSGLTSGKDYNIHWIFEDYINNLKLEEVDKYLLESIKLYIVSRKLNFVVPLYKDRKYKEVKEILKESFKYKELRRRIFSILIRMILRR